MGSTASPYPKLKRPATLDFLSAKTRPWAILDIHNDFDAVRSLREAERALGEAELAAKGDKHANAVVEAKAAVEKARKAVEATTGQWLVSSIGRKATEELVTKHPPRDEDHQALRDNGGGENAKAQYNADTYPAALIAASLVEPKLSEDEVARLIEEWTQGEYLTVWLGVLGVNQDSSLVGPGKASSNGSSGTNGSTKS